MPHLETVLATVSGDKCFANIDLCHGYWQLALHPNSQECLSFITPSGVFSPTRVFQGQTNAAQYFQSVIEQICTPIQEVIIQWLDDLLFHCRNTTHLLQSLRSFFELCRDYNIKLNARKCQLYLTEVKCCGRLISANGIKLDPARIEGLITMPTPENGEQLQQFLCAANWLRSTIPTYTTLVAPLHAILEEVYQLSQNRTSRAVPNVKLTSTSWNNTQDAMFERIKTAIAEAAS